MKTTTTQFRCLTCNKECDHTINMKVFEDADGFWVGTGPYSKEMAEEVMAQAIMRIDEYNKKNIA